METKRDETKLSNTSRFKFRVNVIESERGWGQKIDEVKEFDTYEEAEAFIKETNDQNNLPDVPDLYWRAERANYQQQKNKQ